jgi:hypothetical protein
MSRPPSSRSRRRFAVVAVIALALVGVACNPPSNEPDEYDDTTRSNFLEGCTGIVTEGTALDASTSSIGEGADPSVCECQYEWFVDNLPFDSDAAEQQGQGPDAVNFVELNQQLEDDPNSMPEDIQSSLRTACLGGGGPTTQGTGEAQTGTSAPPGTNADSTTTSS